MLEKGILPRPSSFTYAVGSVPTFSLGPSSRSPSGVNQRVLRPARCLCTYACTKSPAVSALVRDNFAKGVYYI